MKFQVGGLEKLLLVRGMTDACNEAQPEGIAVPMKFPARMREFPYRDNVSRVEKLEKQTGEAVRAASVEASARVAVAA